MEVEEEEVDDKGSDKDEENVSDTVGGEMKMVRVELG